MRLGEMETRARNDRIAAAMRTDVTIDLTDVDTAHLLVEHRAACAERNELRARVRELEAEVRRLRSFVEAQMVGEL